MGFYVPIKYLNLVEKDFSELDFYSKGYTNENLRKDYKTIGKLNDYKLKQKGQKMQKEIYDCFSNYINIIIKLDMISLRLNFIDYDNQDKKNCVPKNKELFSEFRSKTIKIYNNINSMNIVEKLENSACKINDLINKRNMTKNVSDLSQWLYLIDDNIIREIRSLCKKFFPGKIDREKNIINDNNSNLINDTVKLRKKQIPKTEIPKVRTKDIKNDLSYIIGNLNKFVKDFEITPIEKDVLFDGVDVTKKIKNKYKIIDYFIKNVKLIGFMNNVSIHFGIFNSIVSFRHDLIRNNPNNMKIIVCEDSNDHDLALRRLNWQGKLIEKTKTIMNDFENSDNLKKLISRLENFKEIDLIFMEGLELKKYNEKFDLFNYHSRMVDLNEHLIREVKSKTDSLNYFLGKEDTGLTTEDKIKNLC